MGDIQNKKNEAPDKKSEVPDKKSEAPDKKNEVPDKKGEAKDKKSEAKDKKNEAPIVEKKKKEKTKKGNPIKLIGLIAFIFAFVVIALLFVYLTMVNLAFFGVLPKKTAIKLPFAGNIVKKIYLNEKKVKWAKEEIEDKKQVKKAGQLSIDLEEDADVNGAGEKVPFLYKLRVIKYTVKDKELAEVWIDNVMCIKLFVGVGDNTVYGRGKFIAKKLNEFINKPTDFNTLLPVIEKEDYKAMIGTTEIFRVKKEDAIFDNTSQKELLYKWINGIRVALGATLLEEPKVEIEVTDIKKEVAEEKKKIAESVTAAITVSTDATPTVDEKKLYQDKLKSLAAIYEKMELDAIIGVFSTKTRKEVEEILLSLGDKKLVKLFAAMDPKELALSYKEMTGGKLTAEAAKNFKKLVPVWEKLTIEETLKVFENLSLEEKKKIVKALTVKKKSKLFSAMSKEEATKYLGVKE